MFSASLPEAVSVRASCVPITEAAKRHLDLLKVARPKPLDPQPVKAENEPPNDDVKKEPGTPKGETSLVSDPYIQDPVDNLYEAPGQVDVATASEI